MLIRLFSKSKPSAILSRKSLPVTISQKRGDSLAFFLRKKETVPTFSKKSGSVALAMVLMITALIAAIAIEISSRAQVTASLVKNKRDHAKAYELAKAGFRWSVMRLRLDQSLDKIPQIPGTNYGGKKDDLSEMQWAFPLPYPLPGSGGIMQESGADLADELGGTFVSTIYDESAKINLNDVGSGGPAGNKRWTGTSEVLENLMLSYRFRRFNRDQDHRRLMFAIEDWTDDDSQVNHMSGGIEDTEYAIDIPNFHVKNGPFYTIPEIKMLKVMDDDLYRELKPFVTVYPFDAKLPKLSTQTPTPKGKINVNTAPMETIAALFNRQAMPDLRARLECAQLIVQARSAMAFRKIRGDASSFMGLLSTQCGGAIEQGEGNYPIISRLVEPILDVRSDYFFVEAVGNAGRVSTTISAVVSRKNAQKPQILYWRVN